MPIRGYYPALPGAQTTHGADTANTRGTSVTAGAVAHTKNATWTQLVAATSVAYNGLTVFAHGVSSDQKYLLDIGVGAAASETVLIPDLHFTSHLSAYWHAWRFPVKVPAGTRISARSQSGPTGARVAYVMVVGDAGLVVPFPGPTQVATYGATAADSGLTAVDPGGTAHTKGSWVQATASSGFAASWLCLQIAVQDFANIAASTFWLIDVGVGGAGSEVVKLTDLPSVAFAASDAAIPSALFFPVGPADFPAGSRIAVRAQCNVTTSPDRVLDLAVTIAG